MTRGPTRVCLASAVLSLGGGLSGGMDSAADDAKRLQAGYCRVDDGGAEPYIRSVALRSDRSSLSVQMVVPNTMNGYESAPPKNVAAPLGAGMLYAGRVQTWDVHVTTGGRRYYLSATDYSLRTASAHFEVGRITRSAAGNETKTRLGQARGVIDESGSRVTITAGYHQLGVQRGQALRMTVASTASWITTEWPAIPTWGFHVEGDPSVRYLLGTTC